MRDDSFTINRLERAVVKVVAFFDLFDHPVTAKEIWSFLEIQGVTFKELWEFLDANVGNILSRKDGFYFFKGREELVELRHQRFNFASQKIKKASRVAALFKVFPGIKMVAVSNMIGAYNLRKDSDIDLFIITSSNRIWTARFFCVVVAELLRLRPKPGKEKDKICLNFFISEEAYDLADMKIEEDDPYLVFWITGLFPVYNIDYTYEKFVKTNNWIRNKIPHWRLKLRPCKVTKKRSLIYHNSWIQFVFDKAENICRKLQLKMLPSELRNLNQKEDTRVVINNRMLKLHSKDRRIEYNERFRRIFSKTLELLK